MKRLILIGGAAALALTVAFFSWVAYDNREHSKRKAAEAETAKCVGVLDTKTGDWDEVTHEDAYSLWREGLVTVEHDSLLMEFRGKQRRVALEKVGDARLRGWSYVCP